MARVYLTHALPLVVALVAGAIILAVGGDDTVLLATGLGIVAIAAVLLISLFFYEVGRSEDRAEAAERAEAAAREHARERRERRSRYRRLTRRPRR
jgi:ABC-type transport system involved in cytochrome bd biosynthesis fused ATPase/permease subunit